MIVLLSAAAVVGLTICSSSEATQPGTTESATFEQVEQWVHAYRAAHPKRGGKDWDINAKSKAEIDADPAARQLLSICGPHQRPVIPFLAWEYGGGDHRWIKPEGSALVYCVYTPVAKRSANWSFDAAKASVVADVYVKFPAHNPCKNKQGRDQVAACIGDESNFEILVDTASINDGKDAGLNLAEASTELRLILPDGSKVSLAVDR
jgi:hypothetical protein